MLRYKRLEPKDLLSGDGHVRRLLTGGERQILHDVNQFQSF
jgi:hypothetical protein